MDCYFLSPEEFRQGRGRKTASSEWEEVYSGHLLRHPAQRESSASGPRGHVIVLDVDVIGGTQPQSVIFGDRRRLRGLHHAALHRSSAPSGSSSRGTDAPEAIERRVAKAEFELTKAPGIRPRGRQRRPCPGHRGGDPHPLGFSRPIGRLQAKRAQDPTDMTPNLFRCSSRIIPGPAGTEQKNKRQNKQYRETRDALLRVLQPRSTRATSRWPNTPIAAGALRRSRAGRLAAEPATSPPDEQAPGAGPLLEMAETACAASECPDRIETVGRRVSCFRQPVVHDPHPASPDGELRVRGMRVLDPDGRAT